MTPLPFEWLDKKRATFQFKDHGFGIFVDFLTLSLDKSVDVANISFGRIEGSNFNNAGDLDTSLTNLGHIRTILSTVAAACISNKQVTSSDVICLASTDQAKDKRTLIYSVALSEIRSRVIAFSSAKDIKVLSPNGTKIILLSKIEFTEKDKLKIASELGNNKT